MRVTECLANADRTPTEYELEIPMRGQSMGLARIRATDFATVRTRYNRWREDKSTQDQTPALKARWERLARKMESLTYSRYLFC